jgi:purine-binding chemotaxis protein CheW
MTPEVLAETAASHRPAAGDAAPASIARTAAAEPPAVPVKVLCFRLGGEPCAIDILAVREIRSFEPPTPIPGGGAELRGLLDLRGTVVPVIDLRVRIGHAAAGLPEPGAVIVIDLHGPLVGAIVDGVDDVQELAPEQLRPAPPVAAAGGHLLALARVEGQGRLLQLIDIHRLLASAPRSSRAAR